MSGLAYGLDRSGTRSSCPGEYSCAPTQGAGDYPSTWRASTAVWATLDISGNEPLIPFLPLVIVAIALGIVGPAAKGLLYPLFIGIAVFLGALVLSRVANAAPSRPGCYS